MRIRAVTAALLAAALAFAGCGVSQSSQASSQGDAKLIHFNYGIPTGSYFPLYVAQDLGLFKKHGLAPKFYSFQTGAPLLSGMKSGSLDVITTGLATVFALGQGIPLKYLTWEGDAAAAEGMVASPSSGIKTVKDLGKASKIGAPTGTCAQISLYWAAKKAAIPYKSLHVVNIAPNLYANAFTGQGIDAGVAWSPFMVDLHKRGNHVVGWDADWVPHGGACPEMVAARPAFLQQHPQVAPRLIAVQAEALAAIKNNPKLAVDALVKHLSLPRAVAQGTFNRYFKDYPTYQKQVDPSSRYSLVSDNGLLAQLKLASQTFTKLGVIKQPVPTSKLKAAIDPQYVQAYLKAHK